MEIEDKIPAKFFPTKGKNVTFVNSKEIYVEVKPKMRRGKCLGASSIIEEIPTEQPYTVISNDIWYHIAKHIPPEDVLRFSLICRQTADLVNSPSFWKQLYKYYCQHGGNTWILQLPERLQAHNLRKCDKKALRALVIESLFLCYTPLVDHIQRGYSLDTLNGRTYVGSWHTHCSCVWIMCYKFRYNIYLKEGYHSRKPPKTAANESWETLDTSSSDDESSRTVENPQEGVSLLVICFNRFIPFPSQLLYGPGDSRVRLLDTRQLLSTDMRASSLELDFVDVISNVKTTVKYPQILKYKVLPWWHPDFKKFIK